MKFLLYLVYFFRSVRLRGFGNTLKLIRAELKYEKRFGISTSAIKAGGGREFFHYQGASYLVLLRIFNEFSNELKRLHFIDIGSGKGRAVFVAEFCGFRKLTGVELDPELVFESRQNSKRYRMRQSESEILFHAANALEYRFTDEPTVFFLFNPFNGEVLRKIIRRIKASTKSQTLFVYMNPVYRSVFEEEGLQAVKELRTKHYLEAVIYHL